jgi:putative ABC transport system permease protein
MSALALAWRSLFRQKRRSLLMIAVVTFGFASFALAGGFIAQSFEALREGTIRSVGQLQVVDKRAVGRAEEATLEFGIPDAKRARAVAASQPGVAAVLPRIDFVGLATMGARSIPFLGVGVDPGPESAATLASELVVSGKYLAPDGGQGIPPDGGQGIPPDGGQGIVLGTGLAAALEAKVGDRVTLLATTPDGSLNATDGVVSGLVDVKIKELNDRYLAGGIPLVETLLQSGGSVSKLVVFLRPEADEAKTAAALEKAMQGAGFPVTVLHWEDLAVFYGQVKLLYIGIFGFVGAVLVTIVILAAAIVMTMAVTERTREIGTLRALGTRPSAIRRMFLAEAVLIAIAGSVAGTVLALLIRAILNASGIMLPPPPGASSGTVLHVNFYALAYVAGLLAMLATMSIAAFFPARRAARVPIVEALTHV